MYQSFGSLELTLSMSQLSLLPWIALKNLQIGNVLFWEYDSNLVNDTDTKDYLNKYVQCYVDKHLQPIKKVTIVSFNDKNYFEPLSDEQYQNLNSARNILCFLCIAEQSRIALSSNNFSIGPPSADIFDMVSQNFIPGTEEIAVRSGSATSAGWTLDEIHFQEPWSTGGFFKNLNSDALTALNKLLNSEGDGNLKNRLLRSLEWFRLAHIENGSVSPFFKIVMMASAFEIIFEIPNTPDKALYLAEVIEKKLTDSNFKQETRLYGRKKENKSLSLAAWWGWEFYKLRNDVVHGDNIPFTELMFDDWITQAIVADIIFYSYVIELLFEAKYLDEINKPNFDGINKLFKWV